MKSFLFFLSIIVLLLTACNKNFAPGTPACIRNAIKNQQAGWPIGSVDQYLFQGKLVYAFEPDGSIIADGATEIKDERCNSLCSVGGFGGPAVDSCMGGKFFRDAVLQKNIWKKK
jgi:hypothetical protein